MSFWRRWRRLGRDERAETLRAAALIPLCAATIRLVGLARPLRVIAARARRPSAGAGPDSGMSVRAVERACAYGINGVCLTRSVALMYLLARRGRITDLKIGTRRTADGLAAHAWIEADGLALNDPGNLRAAYTLLPQTRTAA